MATIKCMDGWATKSWAAGAYTYYDCWVDDGAWQTDFSNNGDSDGYCYRPGDESVWTYGFIFKFTTPTISKFHKSSSLKLTLPVMRQEGLAQKGTLYFKLLTSDPTYQKDPDNGRYVFPDELKVTSSNKDVSYSWNLTNYHVNKISVTIETTDLKADTTYYVAVGGSSVLHIGYGKVGNYYDADKGSSYEVSEFSPSSGHWAAELTYETYTDGGNPSIPTLKDNGNNTVALEVKQGKSGTNNALTGTTLTYTIDGGTAKSLSITTKSEGTASYTIDVPNTTTAGSTGCTIKVTIKCTFEHNSTTASKSVTAYYYVAPGIPGKPALTTDSFKNGRLTIRQPWTYEWAAATAGNTKSPVKGYRIYLYKSGESIYTVDLAASELSYTFNPVDFGYKPKNTVALGIFAWAENGAGSRLWSGNAVGSSTTPLYSAATEIQNAGIVHVKVNGFWQEGQVWVKMNGSWNEAETVNTKVNGTWEESQ